jgi:hypothetical protein
MAAPTDRSPAGLLVCLAELHPDRRAPATRCVKPSCEGPRQVKASPQDDREAVFSNRILRFAYWAIRREGSTGRTTSSHKISTPTKTLAMDRSIAEGVN